MNNLYPLKFEPILKSVIWGGNKIAPYKGISTELKNIGESWELSGVKNNESVVSEGTLKGRNISSLIAEYKEKLLGGKVYAQTGNEFPLLIKFIDAESDLSIQVHPDDELAASRHNGSKGKTEMWYVAGASEDAHLLTGFSKKITPEEYVKRVENNTITECLKEYKVKEGDVFFLPAGRVHAICGGCFIAEIQQTSDITYRIYDYGRTGLDGKPRELHTELAKDAINFEVCEDYRTLYDKKMNCSNTVVDCRYFTTSVLELDKDFETDLSGTDSFMVLMCVGDSGHIVYEEGDFSDEVSIRRGETVLIPAACKKLRIIPDGKIKLLSAIIL